MGPRTRAGGQSVWAYNPGPGVRACYTKPITRRRSLATHTQAMHVKSHITAITHQHGSTTATATTHTTRQQVIIRLRPLANRCRPHNTPSTASPQSAHGTHGAPGTSYDTLSCSHHRGACRPIPSHANLTGLISPNAPLVR